MGGVFLEAHRISVQGVLSRVHLADVRLARDGGVQGGGGEGRDAPACTPRRRSPHARSTQRAREPIRTGGFLRPCDRAPLFDEFLVSRTIWPRTGRHRPHEAGTRAAPCGTKPPRAAAPCVQDTVPLPRLPLLPPLLLYRCGYRCGCRCGCRYRSLLMLLIMMVMLLSARRPTRQSCSRAAPGRGARCAASAAHASEYAKKKS